VTEANYLEVVTAVHALLSRAGVWPVTAGSETSVPVGAGP
jgi:hypothetical protein